MASLSHNEGWLHMATSRGWKKYLFKMNVVCVICSDFMEEGMLVTRCGHMYHVRCLMRWLERDQSCPQCRCREPDPRRVYPTTRGPNNAREGCRLVSELQENKLRMRTMENMLQRSRSDMVMLKKQLANSETAVVMFKHKSELYRRQAILGRHERVRADLLQRRVNQLKPLHILLQESLEEGEILLYGQPNLHALTTYSVALHRGFHNERYEGNISLLEMQRSRRRFGPILKPFMLRLRNQESIPLPPEPPSDEPAAAPATAATTTQNVRRSPRLRKTLKGAAPLRYSKRQGLRSIAATRE